LLECFVFGCACHVIYGLITGIGVMTYLPLLALFKNESTDKVCTNMKIEKVMSAPVSCCIRVYKEYLIIEIAELLAPVLPKES
jgi:hypothetical protein